MYFPDNEADILVKCSYDKSNGPWCLQRFVVFSAIPESAKMRALSRRLQFQMVRLPTRKLIEFQVLARIFAEDPYLHFLYFEGVGAEWELDTQLLKSFGVVENKPDFFAMTRTYAFVQEESGLLNQGREKPSRKKLNPWQEKSDGTKLHKVRVAKFSWSWFLVLQESLKPTCNWK